MVRFTVRWGLMGAIFASGFFAASSPALAQSLTDELCGTSALADGRYPSDGTLLAAAERSEQQLESSRASGSSPDGVLATLDVPAETAAEPSAEALARYCAAAGEVMRLSVEGSQLQAQNYLLTSLREARSVGLDQLTSAVAYRLGLVSLSGPAVGGARGSGAVRRSGQAIVGQVRAAQAVETSSEACVTLASADLESNSNAALSALALDCAARLARGVGDARLSALASLRLARFGLSWSESATDDADSLREMAREAAIAAIPIAADVADPVVRAELIGRLVETALELGAGDHPIFPAAVAAMRQGEAGDPATAALVAAVQARIALARGDAGSARDLIETALLFESQRPLPLRTPTYFLLLAEADPGQRSQHVAAAYTALTNLRPLMPRIDPVTEESMFALYMRKVFEEAVEVQLAAADAGGGDTDARVRVVQQIVEAYRQEELLSAVGAECLPPRNPLRPADLAAGETLLYPLLLRDRVELIYVSGNDPQGNRSFRRLPANRQADRQTVTRLVEDIVLSMSFGQDEDWREPARRLYDILIRPIEHELPAGSMLAIIPDGPLRALPFGALLDAEGRFLVERTRLSVAPALAYSQPGASAEDGQFSVVAASLQRQVTLPAGSFDELQGTAAEARIAAQNGAPGRLIEDFRKADLVSALGVGDVDVLHLATHASFNGRSDRAFIVANGEAIRLSELRDIIARSRSRGEPLDLLVLSACETAVGDDEASMGLAGAAVQAGALSAIASLWQVDDIGTAELMREFYTRYRAGRSRSEALREAQLALIEAGGNTARPNIWAAFTLLGAWR